MVDANQTIVEDLLFGKDLLNRKLPYVTYGRIKNTGKQNDEWTDGRVKYVCCSDCLCEITLTIRYT